MAFLVAKADGTTEQFDRGKLLQSLQHSGAPQDIAERVTQEIETEFAAASRSHAASTSEIYRHALSHLRRGHSHAAARYSLKRAVLDFGPSGFPFEAYIAELFRAEGYQAKINQIVRGACVEHEIDVVRTRGPEVLYVEAKFHNTLGFTTDLKTVLYVKARIDDLNAARSAKLQRSRGLVVTNTKFTDKAIEYSTCAGLELLGWDYPRGNTLHERIDKAGVYPITALTSLSRRQKMALLQDKTVLCNALSNQTGALMRAGITGKKADAVLEEAGALCVPGKDI